jgi:LPXTG-motif cell wall-anchored protein
MENNDGEKMLPYYWANMVLAGNAEPVKLSADRNEWWWIAAGSLLLGSITLFMLRKKRKIVVQV